MIPSSNVEFIYLIIYFFKNSTEEEKRHGREKKEPYDTPKINIKGGGGNSINKA